MNFNKRIQRLTEMQDGPESIYDAVDYAICSLREAEDEIVRLRGIIKRVKLADDATHFGLMPQPLIDAINECYVEVGIGYANKEAASHD